MGQIGVEGDAVALRQLVALAVADEHHGAPLDERCLAAAGLVHRRVVARAGRAPRCERVAGERCALSGLGGGHHPEAVSAPGIATALAAGSARERATATESART